MAASRPPSFAFLPWPLLLLCLIAVVLSLRLVIGGDPFSDGLAERELLGKRARPQDFATTYTWWMSAVNLVVIGVVLATWRRWRGPETPPGDARFAAPSTRPPGWLLGGVALAMVGLVISAAPRLTHSLWEDETYMVVRSIAGQYEMGDDGDLEFEAAGWLDTFFYYRKPNNHVPYSAAARVAHESWAALARPEHQLVNEVVVRLPALAAALVGLGTTAWLVWRIGLPMAGLVAAWLLALHPWYLRFSSEVRGYSMMLALLPAVSIAALRALERGSWPRWGVFGALQMLLLWTYPGALFVLVIVNLYLLFEVARAAGPERPVQLTRLFVVN
nr:glycosyltransferase family 39 protein [Myxococcota bacterium]